MAKKKQEYKEPAGANPKEEWETLATAKELEDLKVKVEEHQKAIDGFRESFANFETKFRNLVERNRLR